MTEIAGAGPVDIAGSEPAATIGTAASRRSAGVTALGGAARMSMPTWDGGLKSLLELASPHVHSDGTWLTAMRPATLSKGKLAARMFDGHAVGTWCTSSAPVRPSTVTPHGCGPGAPCQTREMHVDANGGANLPCAHRGLLLGAACPLR